MKPTEKMTTPTVFITNNELVDKRIPCNFKTPTIGSVIKQLKAQGYAPEVEAELIKIVSSYPHHALGSVFTNLDKILVRINKKISEKQNL